MAVVTHVVGLPGREPGEWVRVEVAGDVLSFHQGPAPLGWSHYVPLATVATVRLTPGGPEPRLTLGLARRRGAATIALGGAPETLRALGQSIVNAHAAHRGRRGVRRRPHAAVPTADRR
ncbi:MAG TPA: hypothetical protein VFW96_02185 [Thermomicrobiales bacterium]|nr:hypothetical protein [Thermomicrobiales bacterium]